MWSALAHWDYLIVTAANDAQADAYEKQLQIRQRLGFYPEIRNVLVVADPQGKRVGSGGSTVYCLMRVLERELGIGNKQLGVPSAWLETLRNLRILIVHAGGDSRRLPAYSPCGKLFIPVPGESDSALGMTLFDRQLPIYLALPTAEDGIGQVVIAAGDVLLTFDPNGVRFNSQGMTGLGSYASPENASRHGVFRADDTGRVSHFLQKPSPQQQRKMGAVDHYGQSILDIGVLQFDAATAAALLKLCAVRRGNTGELSWSGSAGRAIESCSLDIYREICCAAGYETSESQYLAQVRSSGSTWQEPLLKNLYKQIRNVPYSVQVLPQCRFMHFGTTRQVLTSGMELLQSDRNVSDIRRAVLVNNEVTNNGSISGNEIWVEGCRISSSLTLEGRNFIVGLDVDQPLSLARGQCLDVLRGKDRNGRAAHFVRCYGIDDTFKGNSEDGTTFCNMPLAEWLNAMGAKHKDIWESSIPAKQRTAWNARLFPATRSHGEYQSCLWSFDPATANTATKQNWLSADRYSLAEIAVLTDQDAFHQRREAIRAEEVRQSLRRMFLDESDFSASDLSSILAAANDRSAWVRETIKEARWHFGGFGLKAFVFSRVIHTLGSAVAQLTGKKDQPLTKLIPGLEKAIDSATKKWLDSLGLGINSRVTAKHWADAACAAAFEHCGRAIVSSGARRAVPPVNALREDEIVWGRAPARLDICGGWSDTPPYSLEHGGCVLNAAVNLNGQAPIQCYARVTKNLTIQICSIDLGAKVVIDDLADLLDYRSPTSEFALGKATFAIAGFSPDSAAWPKGTTLRRMLKQFGGGIELTTLAAIPKGSGLGTSSIMGAVMLAVVSRVMGRSLQPNELFHGVLRLEQALTTGGGWQDQVGGASSDVKIITTEPGIIPDPRIHYELSDVLDPHANGGITLLYYTGLTRLAKNILRQVVGRYMSRDRAALSALRRIHALPRQVSKAMAGKDSAAFGRLVDVSWRLNKQLDADSSNPHIEALLERVRPHVHGCKLLGAGGGGFLLMVCKSPDHAAAVRKDLETRPPNNRARFFDFSINRQGLVVTVC